MMKVREEEEKGEENRLLLLCKLRLFTHLNLCVVLMLKEETGDNIKTDEHL
jgi:hypothetical protein